ncbi:MAG: hypothetical protein ABIV63_06505 [Caldimonas sp.]
MAIVLPADLASTGAGIGAPVFEQPNTDPRIAAASVNLARRRASDMWLILLEAFGALVVLLLIVWWTMFHGRNRGEPK